MLSGEPNNIPHLTDFGDRIWAWYEIAEGGSLSFGEGNIVMLFFVIDGKVRVSDSVGNAMYIDKGGIFLKPMGLRYDLTSPPPRSSLWL